MTSTLGVGAAPGRRVVGVERLQRPRGAPAPASPRPARERARTAGRARARPARRSGRRCRAAAPARAACSSPPSNTNARTPRTSARQATMANGTSRSYGGARPALIRRAVPAARSPEKGPADAGSRSPRHRSVERDRPRDSADAGRGGPRADRRGAPPREARGRGRGAARSRLRGRGGRGQHGRRGRHAAHRGGPPRSLGAPRRARQQRRRRDRGGRRARRSRRRSTCSST